MNTHILTLLNDFVMGIEHTPILNGQTDCPGDTVSQLFFPVPDFISAKIKTVIAQIHAERQQGILVDPGNGVPYQIVIGAAF